jgi:hypothetical protein
MSYKALIPFIGVRLQVEVNVASVAHGKPETWGHFVTGIRVIE